MPNDELMQKYLPDLAAEKQRLGSARNDNFLLDLVLKMTDAAFGSPGDAHTGGILGPIGRTANKAYNQSQKKVVKALFKGDPQTLQEVVASPRMMNVQVPGAGAKFNPQTASMLNNVLEGAFAHYQPGSLAGTIRVDPNVMRGMPQATVPNWLKGRPLIKSGVEGLPDIATHEATHFLNQDLFTGMQGRNTSDEMFRAISALQPFIGQAKFGPQITRKMVGEGKLAPALNEAFSYLAQPTSRSAAGTWLNEAVRGRPMKEGIAQFDEPTRKALQEALTSLLSIMPQGVK